jgi:hypothetical protein
VFILLQKQVKHRKEVTMNAEWSLDVLYKGYQDENFTKDYKKLMDLIKEIKEFVPTLGQIEPVKGVTASIIYLE